MAPNDPRALSADFWPHAVADCELCFDSPDAPRVDTLQEALLAAMHFRTGLHGEQHALSKEAARDFQLLANGMWYGADGRVAHSAALLRGAELSPTQLATVRYSFLCDAAASDVGLNPDTAAPADAIPELFYCDHRRSARHAGAVGRVLDAADSARRAANRGPAWSWRQCYSEFGELLAQGLLLRGNVSMLRKQSGEPWSGVECVAAEHGGPFTRGNAGMDVAEHFSVGAAQARSQELTFATGAESALASLTGSMMSTGTRAAALRKYGALGSEALENVGVCAFLVNFGFEYLATRAATDAPPVSQRPMDQALLCCVRHSDPSMLPRFVGFSAYSAASAALDDLLAVHTAADAVSRVSCFGGAACAIVAPVDERFASQLAVQQAAAGGPRGEYWRSVQLGSLTLTAPRASVGSYILHPYGEVETLARSPVQLRQ